MISEFPDVYQPDRPYGKKEVSIRTQDAARSTIRLVRKEGETWRSGSVTSAFAILCALGLRS